jgi:hypothetical protein
MDVLGLGIQLCKRAKQLFLGLLDDYSGAAAAYSLRKLSRGYSGPIVRVRRDGDADGATNERDFNSTNQIADWVNGKLETTLPADVATSSAAFSLRKVKAGYTGNAVRIRRASDDVEVNVAFDTTGVVSANSAITNVPEEFLSNDFTNGWVEEAGATIVDSNTFTTSANAQGISLAVANGKKLKIIVAGTATGASYRIYDWSDGGIKATLSGTFSTTVEFTTVGNQNKIYFRSTGAGTLDVTSLTIEVINDAGGDTTATTLGGFLTESVNTYASDYSAGVDGWTTTGNGNLAGDIDGIGGRDDNLRFTSAVSDVDVFSYHRRNNVLELGQKYNVTFDFYIPSSNSRLDQIKEIVVGGPTIDLSSFTALDQWVSVSVTTTIGATTNLILIRWEDSSESGDATGDVAYIRNVSINAVGHNAFVHTWYDQSGSGNNATQDATDDQPKIAEAGAVITTLGKPAINFAVGQLLFTDSLIVSLSTNSASAFAVSSQTTLSTTTSYVLQEPDSNISSNFILGGVANGGVLWVNGTEFGTMQTGRTLSGFDWNQSTFQAHINGAASGASGTALVNAEFGNRTGIGGFGGGIGRFQGFMQEIITYKSDQSTNRFKIESNINNYYGIYTASHNGFVHTWYDQSGNSNDATQDTQENDQPKIVSAGSLLADGIDFDGVDDKLNFTALSASDLSIFSVVTFDSVAGQERIIGPQSGANEGFGIGNATTGFFRGSGGAANSPALNATILVDTTTLYSLIRASNTGTFFTDSTASATFSNSDTFAGASLGGATNPVDGSLKEIIIYTSDQTANRSGIESNIADEYGITLP